MTERIYDTDVYCKTFEAVVTDCREGKKRYEIVLDRSAFYPEGGGQPGDTGVLVLGDGTSVVVKDTHESGDDILHYTDQPIALGEKVVGTIDWQKRFDMMQNHSGEHIVSGLIHEKYGYENVGFHMGSDFITIDLSGELTMQQLAEIEEKANAVVWENKELDIRTYDEESVKAVEYRSKKELHGQVRIVTIPDADVCACCGTHVLRTGEIGLIKLFTCEKFRTGVRIQMLCGRRAMEYMSQTLEQNRQVSVALSAKPLATAEAVEKLKNAAQQDAYRVLELERADFARTAQELAGAGDCVLFTAGLVPDSVRRLCNEVMEQCGGISAVFSKDPSGDYKYAIGQVGGDLRSLVKDLNTTLNGRGGGKPFFAQGSVQTSKEEILQWAKEHLPNARVME